MAPQAGYALHKGGELVFQWLENEGVSLYRVEIEANGQQVYAARVRSNASERINRYTAPPFIAEGLADKACAGGWLRWPGTAASSERASGA